MDKKTLARLERKIDFVLKLEMKHTMYEDITRQLRQNKLPIEPSPRWDKIVNDTWVEFLKAINEDAKDA